MPYSRDPLLCGSWFAYARRGSSTLSRQLVSFVIDVKQDRLAPGGLLFIDLWAERAASRKSILADCFGDRQTVLVPVPRRVPAPEDSVWPARSISEALVRHGFAASWEPLIERAHPVTKSAGSAFRPDADEHYRSMTVKRRLPFSSRRIRNILLVDDVVGRGCTMLGAAWKLAEAMPNVTIRAFALARAQGTGEAHAAHAPLLEWLVSPEPGACQRVAAPPAARPKVEW